MAGNKRIFQPLPIICTLIGLVFCLWNLYGSAQEFCLTDGCSIFQDFNIAGISLWSVGLAAFSVLFVIAILHRPSVGAFISGAGLLCDIGLLFLMLFAAPCFNCMIIAFILACTYLSFLAAHKETTAFYGNNKKLFSTLVAFWAVFFIANIGVLAQNTTERWAILGPANMQDAQMQIFFSPSCKSCLELVDSLGKEQSRADLEAKTAWLPVNEASEDIFIIANLEKEIKAGKKFAEALEIAKANSPKEYNLQLFWVQTKLWINKAAVLRTGQNKLPLVEYHGLPKHLSKEALNTKEPKAVNSSSQSQNTSLPFLQDEVIGYCEGSTEDC